MLSIVNYRLNEFRKTMRLSLIWLIFITFIVLLLVLLQEKLQICNYLSGLGYVDEAGYILVESNEQNLDTILNNNTVIINDATYNYSVDKIENNFIYLKSDIPKNIKIKNNILDFKILLEKVTFFNYIFDVLRG